MLDVHEHRPLLVRRRARVDVPAWVLLVGRWIPALGSLGGLAVVGAGRAWSQVWALAPGGWRGLLRTYGVAVAVMALVTCLPALVVGLASPQAAPSGETWLLAAPLLAALVHRLGSVWPGVFAHAVPVSATQLVVVDEGAAGVFVGVVALNAAAMVGAAAWLVRSGPR